MDGRRIRPLFLPPHPRRNQCIPGSERGADARRRSDQIRKAREAVRRFGPEKARSSRKLSYALVGSGYSTPKVSTVTFFIT